MKSEIKPPQAHAVTNSATHGSDWFGSSGLQRFTFTPPSPAGLHGSIPVRTHRPLRRDIFTASSSVFSWKIISAALLVYFNLIAALEAGIDALHGMDQHSAHLYNVIIILFSD